MINKEIGKDIGNYSVEMFKNLYGLSSENKDRIRSYTQIRINKKSLTQETLDELKQTIKFKGFELSLVEYIYYKEGKTIFVEKNWELDNENYYVYSFFSNSTRTTEEIVRLTQGSQYSLIDNLLDDCLVHIYYTNHNNKRCYFQLLSGQMIVGYSVVGSDEEKIEKDIEELIAYNKNPTFPTLWNGEQSNQPICFYKNIKEHEVRFRETTSRHDGIESDLGLISDVSSNNDRMNDFKRLQLVNKGKLNLDLNDNEIMFINSHNVYSIFGGGENYKPSLLRSSFKRIKCLGYLLGQIQDKQYFGTPMNL